MFERSVGKKPVPYIASSRTRTGGMTGVKPALREMVERELVERHRDARRVADDVAEARARHARCALHVEAADLRVLPRLRKRGRLADATQLLRVVLRVAVGRRWMRWVRNQRERRVSRSFGGRELLLRLLERGLDGPQCLELLRCRLALRASSARGARRPRG